MPAKLIQCGEFITKGERKAAEYLRDHLSEDTTILTNLEISSGEFTCEIDMIVINDRCVWVIDEKGLHGIITGDVHTWVLSDGHARERVISNICQAARILKGRLITHNPSLNDVWVEGLVMLSADDVKVAINDPLVKRHVRPLAGCEGYFTSPPFPEAKTLSAEKKQKIIECVHHSIGQRLRKRLCSIGEYDLKECLARNDWRSVYAAEHRRFREYCEIRVYDLSVLPNGIAHEEALNHMRREHDALMKLRDDPNIVRIRGGLEPVPGHGKDLHYFVVDAPGGPVLAHRLKSAGWSAENRLKMALNLVSVVHRLHTKKIIHRNLTPAVIYLWGDDEDIKLSGFEFSRIDQPTIAGAAHDYEAGPYTAPEVAVSLSQASRASDVYSLGVILWELLVGVLPFGTRPRNQDDPDPKFPAEMHEQYGERAKELEALLLMLLEYAADKRPDELSTVQDMLDELFKNNEDTTAGEAAADEKLPTSPLPPQTHPLPVQAHLGSKVILSYLGCGGNFYAYRVAEADDDSKEYVAKVVRYPELLQTAEREFVALGGIHHDNIVTAVAMDKLPEAPYHILEHYIPGKTLHEIITQDGPQPVEKVLQWSRELADALAYLETRNPPVYHGDISSRNIMISDHDTRGHKAMLIDFGLAHVDIPGVEAAVVGTAAYRPPERDLPGTAWPLNGDVYSLAISLSEALLGELPYETSGGERHKRRLRETDLRAVPDITEGLVQILLKAMAPDPGQRFANATALLHALKALEDPGATTAPVELHRMCNPLVSELVKLYSRGRCNVENRGLDSEYAWQTYVNTELDDRLWPQIRDHAYTLVILTGNPGDGKTAFFQQVACRLNGNEHTPSVHHWTIRTQDDWEYQCVLDGSASDQERGLESSDAVLEDFFAPLIKAGDVSGFTETFRRTHLLAINDGRLLEYLEERDDWLADEILIALGEQPGQASPRIALVDLNERSLFSREANPEQKPDAFTSIFEALLDQSQEEKPWDICRQCRAVERCHIHYNVTAFQDPVLGPQVKSRLRQLLQLVHARARLHLTIRELRSFIAYLLTNDIDCETIHRELEEIGVETEIPQARPDVLFRERLYWNRLFTAKESAGPLYEELSVFDPAHADDPRLDREVSSALLHSRGIGKMLLRPERGKTLIVHPGTVSVSQNAHTPPQFQYRADREHIRQARRLLAIEGNSDTIQEVLALKAPHQWLSLLPYRSVGRWLKTLQGSGADDLNTVRDLLCRAINETENIPDRVATNDHVAVRTTHSDHSDLLVARRYPREEFHVTWEPPLRQSPILDHLPRALILAYGDQQEPAMEVGLDLFEMLMRFADGFRLGPAELAGIAANLRLFKSRLLALSSEEVILLHPLYGTYMAKQQYAGSRRRIVLQEVNDADA